jgi:hypothetical protein
MSLVLALAVAPAQAHGLPDGLTVVGPPLEEGPPADCGQYCQYQEPVGEVTPIEGGMDERPGDDGGANGAAADGGQYLQQVGGDQYANADGSGNGDVAAANNQGFGAAQVQQSAAIAGNGNAAAQNIGNTSASGSGGSSDHASGGRTSAENTGSGGTSGSGNSGTSGYGGAAAGTPESVPASSGASGSGGAGASGADSGAVATLPDTGGYGLIALGAGALLLAAGLVARRMIR